MFRRLVEPERASVRLMVDGRAITAAPRDSVAAALLAAGMVACRTTPVSATPRAPYCMMGICFECLVTIDGVGSRQACLTRVREGMVVEMQQGKREPGR
jgi:D-hydroxyproline dehydrogenase subunit gamma